MLKKKKFLLTVTLASYVAIQMVVFSQDDHLHSSSKKNRVTSYHNMVNMLA